MRATVQRRGGASQRSHVAQESSGRPSTDGPAVVFLFVIFVALVLGWAWLHRADGILTPEHGAGYALGVAGALMMVALLLYPLRKRFRFMRAWGRVAFWFRWHMIFGIIGPLLVVLHSNFQVQSANAAMALLAMLVVAGSGVVGRYLYARVHRGLYGSKLEARELLGEAAGLHEQLGVAGTDWDQELGYLEELALASPPGFFAAIARSMKVGARAQRVRGALTRALDRGLVRRAAEDGWTGRELREQRGYVCAHVADYFRAIRKAVDLGVYERLFAAWHILHLPLFFLLIVTAIIHVVAVHLY